MTIPKILWCINFKSHNLPVSVKRTPARYVYDYELELYTSGDGIIIVDDEKIAVHKGRIMLRKPGQYVQGILPYDCIFMGFDLHGIRKHPPNSEYFFDKEKAFQPPADSWVQGIETITDILNINQYEELFLEIFDEFHQPSKVSDIMIGSNLLKILTLLYKHNNNEIYKLKGSSHYSKIMKAINYIKNNIDKKFSLAKLAKTVYLSPNYFHKIFKDTMHMTPLAYYNKIKVQKCCELLTKTDYPIVEISNQCGFGSPAYFSCYFLKQTGQSPSDYRKRFTSYL